MTLGPLEKAAVTHVIVSIRQTVTVSTDIVTNMNVTPDGKDRLAKPVCNLLACTVLDPLKVVC